MCASVRVYVRGCVCVCLSFCFCFLCVGVRVCLHVSHRFFVSSVLNVLSHTFQFKDPNLCEL